MRKALGGLRAGILLIFLSGCASPKDQQPSDPLIHRSLKTPAECLQAIADALEASRTIRVRFQHEITDKRHDVTIQHKVGSAGILLLGEMGKLSLAADTGRGGPYRVVSNGTDSWADAYDISTNAQKQFQGSITIHESTSGIRRALAYRTIMCPPFNWSDPSCFAWPERKVTVSPPTDVVFHEGDQCALSYSIRAVFSGDSTPMVFKATLWYDPGTLTIKKRSISFARYKGDPEITFTEIYDEFVLNAEMADEAFVVPPAPTALDATRKKLAVLREALDSYLIHNRAYPTTGQGLDALLQRPATPPASDWKGPYVKDAQCLQDGWGCPFNYRCPRLGIDPKGYDLSSSGPDKKPDTPDDILR